MKKLLLISFCMVLILMSSSASAANKKVYKGTNEWFIVSIEDYVFQAGAEAIVNIKIDNDTSIYNFSDMQIKLPTGEVKYIESVPYGTFQEGQVSFVVSSEMLEKGKMEFECSYDIYWKHNGDFCSHETNKVSVKIYRAYGPITEYIIETWLDLSETIESVIIMVIIFAGIFGSAGKYVLGFLFIFRKK